MKKIVYYIASTIDGFIAGEHDDVSGFIQTGAGVETYFNEIRRMQTVIMGRRTYEFAYRFGLIPGDLVPLYSHMNHYIFSDNLQLDHHDEHLKICKLDVDEVNNIKRTSATDIYLCGGGQLAGWLLRNELIDIIKVKFNPVIIGKGVKLFENLEDRINLNLIKSEHYRDGLQVLSYEVNYLRSRINS